MYERKPTSANKYHGNLFILGSLDKGMKNMIKNQLALLGQSVIHSNPFVMDIKAVPQKDIDEKY